MDRSIITKGLNNISRFIIEQSSFKTAICGPNGLLQYQQCTGVELHPEMRISQVVIPGEYMTEMDPEPQQEAKVESDSSSVEESRKGSKADDDMSSHYRYSRIFNQKTGRLK